MRLGTFALTLGLLLAGCLKSATYECSSDHECTSNGTQGTCESVGYCSFPDSTCTTGQRFGNLSAGFANQCVTDGIADAGVDAGSNQHDDGGSQHTDGNQQHDDGGMQQNDGGGMQHNDGGGMQHNDGGGRGGGGNGG